MSGNSTSDNEKELLQNERNEALEQFEGLLEPIVVALGFVWLGLLVIELVWGSTAFLQFMVWVIWGIFLVDFAIRFILAPQKVVYLRRNWLTAISLLIPALRFLRIVRAFRLLYATRAVRGTQLIRIVSSINRGIRSLRNQMQRRGVGYVVILSIIVAFVGAAGIFAFERPSSGGGLQNYWDALYWTAMMLTTMGSSYWPVTGEGRVIAFLLSLYAFTMFGYITATLATFFIGRDVEDDEQTSAVSQTLRELQMEVERLRKQVEASNQQE